MNNNLKNPEESEISSVPRSIAQITGCPGQGYNLQRGMHQIVQAWGHETRESHN